jgi:hypothetical protein
LLLVGVAAAEPVGAPPSFFLTIVHWSRAYFEVLKLARVDTFSQSVYEELSLATEDVGAIPLGADRTYISFQDSGDCLQENRVGVGELDRLAVGSSEKSLFDDVELVSGIFGGFEVGLERDAVPVGFLALRDFEVGFWEEVGGRTR